MTDMIALPGLHLGLPLSSRFTKENPGDQAYIISCVKRKKRN